eukprot:3020244-Ditylum_brightwellii.AAC.1
MKDVIVLAMMKIAGFLVCSKKKKTFPDKKTLQDFVYGTKPAARAQDNMQLSQGWGGGIHGVAVTLKCVDHDGSLILLGVGSQATSTFDWEQEQLRRLYSVTDADTTLIP